MNTILTPEFIFTEDEKNSVKRELLEIEANPYKNYEHFRSVVREYSDTLAETRFLDFVAEVKERDQPEHPCVTMGNCPIDDDIPPSTLRMR